MQQSAADADTAGCATDVNVNATEWLPYHAQTLPLKIHQAVLRVFEKQNKFSEYNRW
jgi:hypothetical protein